MRLAEEGASIIAVDIAGPVATDNGYVPATADDLQETVRLVEAQDRRIVAEQGDVRDLDGLRGIVSRGVAQLGGRLDVVVANAGISNWNRFWEMSEAQWQTMIDVNLTGVWKTMAAAVPTMIEAGNGGSIITISSVAGIKSLPAQAHYSAAKHGVVGLTKTAAIELGGYGIRVNSIHPWGVDTEMGRDSNLEPLLSAHPEFGASFGSMLPQLPVAAPRDISEGVLYLASDLSRAVTGTQLTIDMGATKV